MLKYWLNFGRGSVKATELGLRLVTRSKIPYVMFIYFRWLALDKALDTVVDPEGILITFYVQH